MVGKRWQLAKVEAKKTKAERKRINLDGFDLKHNIMPMGVLRYQLGLASVFQTLWFLGGERECPFSFFYFFIFKADEIFRVDMTVFYGRERD